MNNNTRKIYMPIHYKDDACVPTNSIENYNIKWLNLSFILLQLWYHIDISTNDISNKYWKNPIRVEENKHRKKQRERDSFIPSSKLQTKSSVFLHYKTQQLHLHG